MGNQRCNSLLNKARNYMRQDLHIATKIGEPIGLGCEDMDGLFKTKTNTNLNIDVNVEEEILPLPQGMSLKDGLFKFPPCQVSHSIIELKELVNNVINEAIESKE